MGRHSRSTIIAGMDAGCFKPAPIWDDVTNFNGTPYKNAIDTILAGYPCQPFSQTGQPKRANNQPHLLCSIYAALIHSQMATVCKWYGDCYSCSDSGGSGTVSGEVIRAWPAESL
ncbi:MAG: DNA cytosine methyltransferase [Rhodobacteraceae bacterium]|nr:DNA cytosine methyltransferase [Paracoccaceae bacterium]